MRHLCARLLLLATLLAVVTGSLSMTLPAHAGLAAGPAAGMTVEAATTPHEPMVHDGSGCPSAAMTGKDSLPGQGHCAKAMCCFHQTEPRQPVHVATLRQADFGGPADVPVRQPDPARRDKPPKHT